MDNKKHLLIIEDEKLNRDLYEEQFETSGFSVDLAENGKKAFKCLKKRIPDLILLDLIMPGMNGFDFLEMIRRNSKWKDIPVLVLSNLGS